MRARRHARLGTTGTSILIFGFLAFLIGLASCDSGTTVVNPTVHDTIGVSVPAAPETVFIVKYVEKGCPNGYKCCKKCK